MTTFLNIVFRSSSPLILFFYQFPSPLKFILYLAKALSLGLRLTANMIDSLALFFVLTIIFDSVIVTEMFLIYYPNSTIPPDIENFYGLLSL